MSHSEVVQPPCLRHRSMSDKTSGPPHAVALAVR